MNLTNCLLVGVWLGFSVAAKQTVRVIDELRRRPTLGAQCLSGWMGWIRFKSNKATILNYSDRTTSRDTQGAVPLNLFVRLLVCEHPEISFLLIL